MSKKWYPNRELTYLHHLLETKQHREIIANSEIINNEIGPPKMIPTLPVRNIIIALKPSFFIPGKSTLIVRSTKLVGNKYLDATKYKLDSSPEIIPNEFSTEGMK